MPVDFQQIRTQIKDKGPAAARRQELLKDRIDEAFRLFKEYSNQLEKLKGLVDAAALRNRDLRCAVPGEQALDAALPAPAVEEISPQVILAADGSQINPDRHAQIEFGVVNTGAVRFAPGEPPAEIVDTRLLLGDDLQLESGPMTEEIVALLRDLAERTLLADLAEHESLPVVTLTDGQLELFHKAEQSREYERRLGEYMAALQRLRGIRAITAGYVDRPKGDLVVRLLELTLVSPADYAKVHALRPLRWVLDTDLFQKILAPGERSAVFKIHSGNSESFSGDLALHFFYLNVGDERRDHLARVEIPAWVADRPDLVDRLHAAILSQAQHLGSRPYPYAIHRAHEVAVVHPNEKQQINDLIAREYLSLGIQPGDRSNKQIAKDNFGKRTRIK